MENVEMNLIFSEIKKTREDFDCLKRVVESGIEYIILTMDEEKKRAFDIRRSFW
ncbi:MAG: hypothetical protein KJ714_05410 [Euryarchaeota archaeon]|nr:hypothetical protein [Euryarchaeota archaeon]